MHVAEREPIEILNDKAASGSASSLSRLCYDSAQNTCVFSFWFAVFELHIPINQNNPKGNPQS